MNWAKAIEHYLDLGHLSLLAIALLFAGLHAISEWKKYWRMWRTRYLRKVWGIRNGDHVLVVCSELDNAEQRQTAEPRNFIYNMRYGDVDAYFEVVINLLRLFPELKLRVLSSGEAENTRLDLAQHIILIGGPDYNSFTERILGKHITEYTYKSFGLPEIANILKNEMALCDSSYNKEYYEVTDEKDFGYFERIKNPNDPKKNIILVGGCRTLGVTGAAKAFSMAASEKGEIPGVVLTNAKEVVTKICEKVVKDVEFAVLISVERAGQTINIPIVNKDNIKVKVKF